VQERACRRMVELQTADEQSWTSSLEMQRVRLRFGAQSMQGLARTEGQAAAQRIQLAATEAQCHGLRQALRALAGVEPAVLTSAIALERPDWVKPPLLRSEQPASVLLKHAQMRAATAAADAAFHDLGSAQAARLPSLNLAGLLGHQWVRMLGHDSELKPWSESIALAGPLWDGGAGTARVEAAQARLNGAMANLDQTLRQTVREIETALAQQEAMYRQLQAALQYAQSSDQSWRVSQAAAAAGRLNSLDLEDAARQQRIAQLALVAAQRDLDLAWTGLVKAAGQAPLHFETPP